MDVRMNFVLSTLENGKRNIIYFFPKDSHEDTGESSTPSWLSSPAASLPQGDFFTSDRIFYYRTSTLGNFYSMAVRDKGCTDKFTIYTVFTGYQAVRSGRELVAALKKFEEMSRGGVPQDTGALQAVLDTIQLRKEVGGRVLNPEGEVGYVTYDSDEGLYKRLANVEQRAYSNCRVIAFIPAWEIPEAPAEGYEHITEPLHLIYYVDYPLPKGVSVSQTSIRSGEVLKITYSKPGFAAVTVPVRIDGVSNPHITLKAPRMQILVPSSLNFGHVVKLDCVDEEGNPVNDVRINTLGNRCEVRPGNLIFFEEPKDGYVISVMRTSVGRVSRVTITKADLEAGYKELVFHGNRDSVYGEEGNKSHLAKRLMFILTAIVALYLLYAAAMGLKSGTVWPFEKEPEAARVMHRQPRPNADYSMPQTNQSSHSK